MNTHEPNVGHELLGDLQALAAEAAAVLGQAATGQPTVDGIATLRAQFEVAQSRFSDLYGQAKERTTQGALRIDESVRANPYPSVAIVSGLAALTGFLVGRALKSR